jgi:hypothetical protein
MYSCLLFNTDSIISGLVTGATRQVPLVEQELLILPEHLRAPLGLEGFMLLELYFSV